MSLFEYWRSTVVALELKLTSFVITEDIALCLVGCFLKDIVLFGEKLISWWRFTEIIQFKCLFVVKLEWREPLSHISFRLLRFLFNWRICQFYSSFTFCSVLKFLLKLFFLFNDPLVLINLCKQLYNIWQASILVLIIFILSHCHRCNLVFVKYCKGKLFLLLLNFEHNFIETGLFSTLLNEFFST